MCFFCYGPSKFSDREISSCQVLSGIESFFKKLENEKCYFVVKNTRNFFFILNSS